MANSIRYTVSDLIDSVVRRGSIPVSDTTISNDDIIRFANEEMDENICPLILSTREEIYLSFEDIEIVNGQNEYSIPYRAFGSKVRIIKPLRNDNTEGYPLAPIPVDRDFAYNGSTYSNSTRGFYLRNDKIVITPDINGLGANKIRVYYYLRPNDIVSLNRVSTVTSIDTLTNEVTVDKVPTNIAGSLEVDVIQFRPNHKTRAFDSEVSVNTIAKIITFTTLPESLEVGDYICSVGETPTPQMPVDIIPVLEQATTCKVLEAIGDTEGLKNAYARLERAEKRLLHVIDNRIESPGTKAVNTNSFLRRRSKTRY